MPVVFVHQGPSLTQERYEEAVRRLLPGRQGPPGFTADWPVESLLVHIAGLSEEGVRIVDVWESEDACRRFGEQLMPILQEVGIADQPELYQAHTFVEA
jgi:hypothetical protein